MIPPGSSDIVAPRRFGHHMKAGEGGSAGCGQSTGISAEIENADLGSLAEILYALLKEDMQRNGQRTGTRAPNIRRALR
jgi:hypothetical protein